MVTRVSTIGNYSQVLANLMAAQQAQSQAGNQVATQKNGSNLKDYAQSDDTLISMQTVQARVDGYQQQNTLIADKLTTQDTALNAVGDAATNTRQAIADAIASGRVDTLMEQLQGEMSNAVENMNASYNGKYLFSGGQVNTQPVTAAKLSDLTSGPPISSFFKNDTYKAQAKLDDSTTVTTGMLASDIGTQMLTAFQAIQQFQEGPNGPFTGQLTDAQKSFLESQLSTWDNIGQNLTNMTGQNGLVQKTVDSVNTDLTTQANTITSMTSSITDADMAKAATNLQLAQMSVQAAAQVFKTLQSSSLLSILPAG